MKPLILIAQLILFASGSLIISLDYRNNGTDVTIVGWTGVILCIVALGLVPLLSLIKK
jgi:hypothetical protein